MKVQEYLRDLLDLLLLENYEIELQEDENSVQLLVNVSEEDSGILIGRHGETLTAIQKLIRSVFAKDYANKRLAVNINDYRLKREEKIRSLLERGVAAIKETGQKYYLYRLTGAERFFIHNLIASDNQYQGYKSYSIDDENGSRVLVIEPQL